MLILRLMSIWAVAVIVAAAAPLALAQDEPAPATTAAPATAWPEGDAADIALIQSYLNGLTTYKAKFAQLTPDGGYAEGLFWLARPGKARFEYAPPNDLLLVADGKWITFFDRDIDQVSYIPIDTGPFRFLLEEDIDLSRGMEVRAVERRAGLLRISLQDEEDPAAGVVTLVFEEGPLRLRRWEVIDAQAKLTTVTLYDEVYDLELDGRMFRFTETDRLNPNYRVGEYDWPE